MRSRDIDNWAWGEALSLLEQVERMQREFFRPVPAEQSWEPPVDIFESPEALFVQVALPGVPPEAIAVGLEADAISVSAVRPFPISARGSRLHRVEIPYGRFFRRIALPVDRLEPAGRSFIDGCLTLVFRKRAVNAAR